MKVKKNIKPNNLIHILNNYHCINKNNDDYIVNIYYININKIQVLVRKINEFSGWNHNLKIKIEDKKNNEVFDIGSSKKNYKKINLFSRFITFKQKNKKKLKIPKIILQTHKSDDFTNMLALNSIQTFLDFNPDYEYVFYDDIDCREFIKINYDSEYLYYYDIIYPGAFKADFFRYCYLYINGGFYFDCKSILLSSLDDLVNEDDELILCQDYHKLGLYNAVMMTTARNELFIKLINKIIYKIKNFKEIYKPHINFKNYIKLDNILSLTGPNLLYEEFMNMKLNYNDHIFMKHDILGNYKNFKNLVIKFNNKVFLYKNYNNFSASSNHYSILWKNHKIFYKNHSFNNNHHFFVAPNNSSIDLDYYMINNKILVVSNSLINTIDLTIINSNSIIKCINLQNITNNYTIINYDFNVNHEFDIINYKVDNEIVKKNYEFAINKIYSKYYLIILNLNQISVKDCSINIEAKEKNFDFNFSNLLNKTYLIYSLDLFNI